MQGCIYLHNLHRIMSLTVQQFELTPPAFPPLSLQADSLTPLFSVCKSPRRASLIRMSCFTSSSFVWWSWNRKNSNGSEGGGLSLWHSPSLDRRASHVSRAFLQPPSHFCCYCCSKFFVCCDWKSETASHQVRTLLYPAQSCLLWWQSFSRVSAEALRITCSPAFLTGDTRDRMQAALPLSHSSSGCFCCCYLVSLRLFAWSLFLYCTFLP